MCYVYFFHTFGFFITFLMKKKQMVLCATQCLVSVNCS